MIQFKKYHGCGNSFILVKEKEVQGASLHQLAAAMCESNTGIGADGLIIVREDPRLEMLFFNKDGTSAPMCGNGIRCFAAFCADEGIEHRRAYPVKTMAGDMQVELLCTAPFAIRINMGRPDFSPAVFGVKEEREDFLNVPLDIGNDEFTVNSLFMGTVHTVVFVREFPAEEIGKLISEYPIYTEKTNVNFVKIIDGKTIAIRTFERGVGITPACGTGACASVVVGHMQGKTGSAVSVVLPYGQLEIELMDSGEVMMTGPAVKVFEGCF